MVSPHFQNRPDRPSKVYHRNITALPRQSDVSGLSGVKPFYIRIQLTYAYQCAIPAFGQGKKLVRFQQVDPRKKGAILDPSAVVRKSLFSFKLRYFGLQTALHHHEDRARCRH